MSKLAPVKPIATRMTIGKDIKSGEVFAQEYGSQCKGQMTLDDYSSNVQEIDGNMVNTETGEIIETKNKVVDLRKAAL